MHKPNEGDLQVWWVPQVPMKAFEVPVKTPAEAVLVLDVLAKYDAFQFENNVKGDYWNAGGLNVFEDGEWCDWYSPEDNMDIDEWAEAQRSDAMLAARQEPTS